MKSPARTTGLYGPRGLLIGPTILPVRGREIRTGTYRRGDMNAADTNDRGPATPAWTRRGFIATVLATGALAACGKSDDASSSPAGSVDAAGTTAGPAAAGGGSTPTGGYTIVQRFPQAVQVPGPVRLPVSLSDGDGALLQDGPGDARGAGARRARRRPRRSHRGSPPRRGTGALLRLPHRRSRPRVSTACRSRAVAPEGASFDVADPSKVVVPIPGQPLPPLDTPTVAAPAGVDPICTREPEACPFHDITLTEALASGKQVAYYVGTPAFCSHGCLRAGAGVTDRGARRLRRHARRSSTPRCTPTTPGRR